MGEAVLARFTRFVHSSSVCTWAPSPTALLLESQGLVGLGKCIFLYDALTFSDEQPVRGDVVQIQRPRFR